MPDRHGMADKFHQNRFARFNRQFIWLATRGRCLHLLDFTHYRHFLRRGTGMPRLMFLTCGAQAAGFRHAGECGVSDQLQRVRRAIFDTGRTVFAPCTKVAFMRRGFTFPTATGVRTICIVPNGQATTQDLQPIHFAD